MTIKSHANKSDPHDPDFIQPDATIMGVDCICGQQENPCNLMGATDGMLVYAGCCEDDDCGRALRLTIDVSPARQRKR